jgi:methionine-rich copper-binding protein CopC
VKFASATNAEISIDTAAGVFQVSQAGNLNYFATLMNNSVSPMLRSNVSQAFDASNTSSNSVAASSPVSFTIPVAPGQRIVGEDVAITATDLALSTDYSVVLRSTPQILAQGRTVSSSFNTSVTIPNNLEPGWHSITFNATRSDGAALEEKVYFKINADGTLLASTTDIPAELAFTGAVTAGAIPLSIIVLLLGFAAFFVAREINPDFMRVMTLTRNANGELEFIKRRIRSTDF